MIQIASATKSTPHPAGGRGFRGGLDRYPHDANDVVVVPGVAGAAIFLWVGLVFDQEAVQLGRPPDCLLSDVPHVFFRHAFVGRVVHLRELHAYPKTFYYQSP